MDSVSDMYLRSNLSSQVPVREPVFCLVEKKMDGWVEITLKYCLLSDGLKVSVAKTIWCVCLLELDALAALKRKKRSFFSSSLEFKTT